MKRIAMLSVCLVSMAMAAYSQSAVLTFGLITDTHVCDKADQSTTISLNASPRYFTGGLAKISDFAKAMNEAVADFVAELGDFTDNPANGSLSPAQRRQAALGFMAAAEAQFATFHGPRYHVFGNHDTDQVSKADFLSTVTNTGIPSGSSYYSFDVKGVHVVVIDASFKAGGESYSGVPGSAGSGYSWDDANIPAQELDWLKADLASAKGPVIVLAHQELNNQELVDAAFDPKHSVKNAAALRSILESSKKVLGVFSGHYHDGGYQEINGISYMVLQANAAYGNDVSYHNQYATVKVFQEGNKYTLAVAGHGLQKSYVVTKVID